MPWLCRPAATQATAMILREAKPGRAKFEIRTRNDGLYRAGVAWLQKDALVVSDPALSQIKLQASDIVELRAAQ